jgi:hypothetical protein
VTNNDWDKASDGNLICYPLTGVKTAATANGTFALLRFEYLPHPNSAPKGLQFAITTNEVTRLIGDLQTLEKELRDNLAADKPSGKPS